MFCDCVFVASAMAKSGSNVALLGGIGVELWWGYFGCGNARVAARGAARDSALMERQPRGLDFYILEYNRAALCRCFSLRNSSIRTPVVL